jgi:predicted MFS family arabinose efflux permease
MNAMTGLGTRIGNPAGRVLTMRMFFFMTGIGVSAWAITVPFTKIRFGLDDATLGLILLAPGIGGILAMPLVALLMARFGSRAVLVVCGLFFGALLPTLTVAPNVPAFTALLFAYGVMFAGLDISMNAQAVVIESRASSLLMSSFHALFSLGTLSVAVATSFLLRLGLTNTICALFCSVLCLAIVSRGHRLVPPEEDLPSEGRALAMPNRATFLLGLCCFACFLTEGAATDWSTIFFRFSRGVNIASAPLGYAGFAVMMFGSRLLGDRVAMWLGKAHVMRIGSLIAAAGFMLAILTPYEVTDVIGFGMVGLGIGNIAPLVFSAAARVKGMSPTASVPAVVTLGYVGFLIGPVIIGFVANLVNLSFALGLDAVMMVAISFAANAVETKA